MIFRRLLSNQVLTVLQPKHSFSRHVVVYARFSEGLLLHSFAGFSFPNFVQQANCRVGKKIMWGELCRGHVGYDVLPFSLLRALLPKPMKRGCAHGDAPPFRTGSYFDLG